MRPYFPPDLYYPPCQPPMFLSRPVSVPVYGMWHNVLATRMGGSGVAFADPVPDAPPRPYGEWTSENHFIFELHTRRAIEAWLSVSPDFPPEIQEVICSFITSQ